MNFNRAFVAELENLDGDAKGKGRKAPSRGGLVRSSNEVPVMGMERRDKRNAGQAGQQSGNTLEELGGKPCIPKSRVR